MREPRSSLRGRGTKQKVTMNTIEKAKAFLAALDAEGMNALTDVQFDAMFKHWMESPDVQTDPNIALFGGTPPRFTHNAKVVPGFCALTWVAKKRDLAYQMATLSHYSIGVTIANLPDDGFRITAYRDNATDYLRMICKQ